MSAIRGPGDGREGDPREDSGDVEERAGRDRRALGVYRFLLRLFPRGFRDRRGAHLEELFLEMRSDRSRSGRGTGFGFWIPLLWDTVSHALRERLSGGSPRGSLRTYPADLAADVRYALRTLVRQPLHASLVVLVMTVGIAGNAAVFRIFNGLFLRPLPFEGSERLVDLDTRAPEWDLDYTGVAYADFHGWRAESESFEAMGVLTMGGANLVTEDGAVRVDLVEASHDLTDVIKLTPLQGRFFTAEEDAPGGPRVALVTQAFADAHYGGGRTVGRTAVLDGRSYEIVGVLPEAALSVAEADLWIPLQEDPTAHSSFYLEGVGRLRPGVSPARAEEELTRIHRNMAETFPVNESTVPVVSPLRDRYLGEARAGSTVLLGAVGLVLLIACANIAGLMFARSLARRREVQIRLAVGARRGRIVRQLLTESAVLAMLGATVGALIGVWGSGVLVHALSDQFPTWVTFDTDATFVLFVVLATAASVVLFGLVPALRSAEADPGESLLVGATGATASRRRRRTMDLLVAGEVAVAFLLLVVAGLGLRDFSALRSVEPGFRTEEVLSYVVQLPDGAYPGPEEQTPFWTEHVERLRALPGVVEAAGTSVLPLNGHSGWFFSVEDAPPRPEDEGNPVVLNRAVTPGYLETMGVAVVAGRSFRRGDGRDENERVAVVNETFAREFLGHRDDPLGARIRTGSDDDDPWSTVIGVTRDTKHYGLDREMRPSVYQPLAQFPRDRMQFAVRTEGDPSRLIAPVRETLTRQDSRLAIFDVATMEKRLADSLWPRRAASWLLAAFSTVALVLAVAGVYGVVSYGVRQRLREIGIRMALGARRARVAREVLVQGVTIVVLGTVLGLVGALLAVPAVSEVLFTTPGVDLSVLLGAAVVLAAVAGLANLLPALRATRLDPMSVLRTE